MKESISKASDHIKPCNIAQSEQHNKRDEDYIKSLNPKRLYIRTDLTRLNETYTPSLLRGISLQDYYDWLKDMVKKKTGRAMQERDVEYIDKKGRNRVRRGSSPLREGVVNIKPNTTMSDLQRYAQAVHERWGITAIQIHIHKDEGHFENPDDVSTWQPNYHAHFIWDWMDHVTGKSYKLDAKDMSAMQDLVAEVLDMERGQKKSETGLDHLERNDFIIQKQESKKKQLQKETDDLLSALNSYTQATKVKKEDLIVPMLETDPLVKNAYKAMMAELDIPIPSFKQKEWRDERKKAVKEILTDMQTELRQAKEAQKKDILKLGKSLYDMAMEHIQELIEQDKQLHKENERLAAENEKLKDKISRIDDKAITNLRQQKDKEIGELEASLNRANTDAAQSRSLASREQQRADRAEQQLREMLAVPEIKDIWDSIQQSIQAFWQQVDNWIVEAKDAIRTFAESGLSLFSSEQETVISSGIVGEALKDGLDASDLSQRKQATQNLLGQVDWGDFSKYKCDFGILRTNQLCKEMSVTKEMMTTLLLAAGGHGGVSSGGGGVSGELTNWDGTKKRNGWGNGI
ncbi:hypothetical protein K0G46_04915 [Phocaeicola vulgatus]|uniref:hypothetical protein n=1 Tax=Phocaeicola vulgatus TaxID=821 RepID=UPI001F205800|nr:hypothetical protein [Phocaeicola vulgatus]MCE9190861.1 hypothetical protein [Phocaeicola vulgatus]